jgi:hypothetical protein
VRLAVVRFFAGGFAGVARGTVTSLSVGEDRGAGRCQSRRQLSDCMSGARCDRPSRWDR